MSYTELPAIRIKQGVEYKFDGALKILLVAARLLKENGIPLVWTSGTDGTHMSGSKHYSGEAIDLRTWYMTKDVQEDMVFELQTALGNDYDVVLEPTHIHVEYDPD